MTDSTYQEELADPLQLLLDPHNPRLARDERGSTQERLLEIMIATFDIAALAEAIVATGFLDQDPIAGWRDDDGNTVVREGNRRVSAIKLLLDPGSAPERYRSAFQSLSDRLSPAIREDIQQIRVQIWPSPNHAELLAYIGYRHVTGVRPWPPVEKANFIASLVDQGLDYPSIAERIGSKSRHVERHYLAYQIVEQGFGDEVAGVEEMEASFGVLLRTLQASGIPEYLGVEYTGNASDAVRPIPETHRDEFANFVKWTFGTSEHPKVLKDSRDITRWARILDSTPATEYLERTKEPNFERAWAYSGGEAETLADSLKIAADQLRDAVAVVSDHDEDPDVRSAAAECARFFARTFRQLPDIAAAVGIGFERRDD